MQRRHKAPIVLAALLFVLAAVAEIATGRSRGTLDADTSEQMRQAALARVDEALARHEIGEALRAWQEAYRLARRSRSWRALMDAADTHLRIAAVAGASAAAAPRAREIYLAALGRARADRSVEGAVRAAERFAALGDRDVTELALRVAASLAEQSRDPSGTARIETVRGRLLDGRALAHTTF